VLNCSILDGWWAEGYAPEIGWAIDGGEGDEATQDARDAEAVFALLEQEIVPTYYGRRESWLQMMRASIARVGGVYTSHRMVAQYLAEYYLPAHRETGALLDELERAA
jgi:starch phosphorylase